MSNKKIRADKAKSGLTKQAPTKTRDADSSPPQPSGEYSARMRLEQQSTNGFLPPPMMLRQYEEVLEGSADRMMKMWESEVSSRQEYDDKLATGYMAKVRRGQWFGFIVCLTAIGAGTVLSLMGYPWVGGGSLLTGGAIMATAFLRDMRHRDDDDTDESA